MTRKTNFITGLSATVFTLMGLASAHHVPREFDKTVLLKDLPDDAYFVLDADISIPPPPRQDSEPGNPQILPDGRKLLVIKPLKQKVRWIDQDPNTYYHYTFPTEENFSQRPLSSDFLLRYPRGGFCNLWLKATPHVVDLQLTRVLDRGREIRFSPLWSIKTFNVQSFSVDQSGKKFIPEKKSSRSILSNRFSEAPFDQREVRKISTLSVNTPQSIDKHPLLEPFFGIHRDRVISSIECTFENPEPNVGDLLEIFENKIRIVAPE